MLRTATGLQEGVALRGQPRDLTESITSGAVPQRMDQDDSLRAQTWHLTTLRAFNQQLTGTETTNSYWTAVTVKVLHNPR